MTQNVRILAPATGGTSNGGEIVWTPGQILDVPAGTQGKYGSDVTIIGLVGPTTDRPTNTQPESQAPFSLAKNLRYLDTTLGVTIVYDGATWRNPVTGAAA